MNLLIFFFLNIEQIYFHMKLPDKCDMCYVSLQKINISRIFRQLF